MKYNYEQMSCKGLVLPEELVTDNGPHFNLRLHN